MCGGVHSTAVNDHGSACIPPSSDHEVTLLTLPKEHDDLQFVSLCVCGCGCV